MDIKIQNLDKAILQALTERAALSGKTIDEIVIEALRAYLSRPEAVIKRRSLRELVSATSPERDENLSRQIDHVVYGI